MSHAPHDANSDRVVLFHNGAVILPDRIVEDGVVISEGGRIRYAGGAAGAPLSEGAQRVDANRGFISPGFVDIHVHGGDGADFMDGTPEAVIRAARSHLRHGTTTLFPTTASGSQAELEAMIEACLDVQRAEGAADRARIGGVHLYGPYFAASKAGCHSSQWCRAPDSSEYRRYFDSGIVRIATCAAELPGAAEFYSAARDRGCLITCGHSEASWSEMAAGYKAGLRHVDHFWCAMSSVASVRARLGTPMQGSMEQFVLMHREMSTEVIADGCHLAPELLEYAFIMKGADRLCLVTDANRAMDLPPGRYRFGSNASGEWFESDGRVGWQERGKLASSITGMDAMVRNMVKMTSCGLASAIRMASLTPAERAGMARDTGSLEAGKRADVLILSKELKVEQVFLAGREVEASFCKLFSNARAE